MTQRNVPAPRTSVAENIIVSAANVLAVVGTSLVAVPVIIDHVGVDGYGLWTLGQSVVIYVSTAELGFGPAIGRFVSVGHSEHRHVVPILWMAIVLYALAGAAVVLATHFGAPALVDFFHVPARLHGEAVGMTRIVGYVALATLMAAATGQVMIGLERYRSFAASNAIGGATFLATLLVLLSTASRLEYVAYAALAQWTLVAVLRVIMLLPVLRTGRPRLPHRALVREVFGFSARLQVSVLSTLLNTQTDRVVVGRVSSTRRLGQVSIAAQIAEGSRFLAYAGLNPMISRMAVTFGADGRPGLDNMYARTVRRWQLTVAGLIGIAVAVMRPLVRSWLGAGHAGAATFAVILVLAYGLNLLTGPAIAYLRAVGQPGPEGSYGVVTVVANIVLTVVLGIAFGAIGVVGATLLAYLLSTVWFLRRVRSRLPRAAAIPTPQSVRSLIALVAAAALAFGAAELSASNLPTGVALIGVGVGVGAGFGLYLLSLFDRSDIRRSAHALLARLTGAREAGGGAADAARGGDDSVGTRPA